MRSLWRGGRLRSVERDATVMQEVEVLREGEAVHVGDAHETQGLMGSEGPDGARQGPERYDPFGEAQLELEIEGLVTPSVHGAPPADDDARGGDLNPPTQLTQLPAAGQHLEIRPAA